MYYKIIYGLLFLIIFGSIEALEQDLEFKQITSETLYRERKLCENFLSRKFYPSDYLFQRGIEIFNAEEMRYLSQDSSLRFMHVIINDQVVAYISFSLLSDNQVDIQTCFVDNEHCNKTFIKVMFYLLSIMNDSVQTITINSSFAILFLNNVIDKFDFFQKYTDETQTFEDVTALEQDVKYFLKKQSKCKICGVLYDFNWNDGDEEDEENEENIK